MKVSLFDFDLPEDRVALRPARPRDSARLLVVRPLARPEDRVVRDLAEILQPGDALVFNDTRVIPAQLEGVRVRNGNSASFSATLHMRVAPDRWKAFVKGAKKIHQGDQVEFGGKVPAMVEERGEDGEATFRFRLSGNKLDEALAGIGHVPLPPYIALRRQEDEQDLKDYQTIYAREKGAVAAPTAGLHFTDQLFEKLEKRNISRHFVTLHVGAGTFLPVKSEDTDDHRMHAENGSVSPQTADELNSVKQKGGRIVAVGTTSLRLLESAANENGELSAWRGETDIFITPGYRFRFVDVLMTNFHLPKSTLMMLVSAFSGLDTIKDAYAHAIKENYRFYSYGDASLLFRAT